MLKIKLITEEADFIALEKEWNPLLQRSSANNIFLTWEWISTWWKVFGARKFLHVLTFYKGPELIGIAPFYIRKTKYYGILPAKALEFLGTGENVRSENQDLIIKPGNEYEITRAFLIWLHDSRNWDIAIFKDLRSGSALIRHFENPAAEVKFPLSAWLAENSYAAKLISSYPEYLKALSMWTRKSIKTGRRKLHSKYSVEFKTIDPQGNPGEWMKILHSLHQKRMKQKGLKGKFGDPNYVKFHQAIAEIFMSRRWLSFSGLFINGQPAAVLYGFIYKNKVYGYQSGFDPDFSRDGVMQVLISKVIESGFATGYSEFDLLAGQYVHKVRLANTVRRIFTFAVFNSTMSGRAARMANRARAWTRSAMKCRNWLSATMGSIYRKTDYRFYTRNLADSPPKAGTAPEVVVRKIETLDNAVVTGISRLKNHKDNRAIADRWRKGHMCLTAMVAGQPIAFIWIDPCSYHIHGEIFAGELKSGEAFVYDFLTTDHWRSMNIYPFLLDCAAAELQKGEFRTMLILLKTSNRPSIEAASKAGFSAGIGGFRVLTTLGVFNHAVAIPRA